MRRHSEHWKLCEGVLNLPNETSSTYIASDGEIQPITSRFTQGTPRPWGQQDSSAQWRSLRIRLKFQLASITELLIRSPRHGRQLARKSL